MSENSDPSREPAPEPFNPSSIAIKALFLALFCAGVGFVAAQKLSLGALPGSLVAISVFGVGLYALVKLRGAPKEMGFVFGLKLLSVTAYKLLNFTLVMWLMKDLGYEEEGASALLFSWGIFMTLATIVAGPLTDALGLRRTLLTGVTLCVLTRLVMAFTTNKWIALVAGLMPLAIGEALCTPVLVAAMRCYSKPSQRTVAFSLFYALMNFGFMFAYFVSDAVKESLPVDTSYTVPGLGIQLSQQATLVFVSLVFDLLMFPLIWFLKSGVQMTESGFITVHEYKERHEGSLVQRVTRTVDEALRETVQTLLKLFTSPGFGKLIVFLLMIGLLKIVFNIMDYVLEPFSEREIGPESTARVGRLNATNSIMILVLAPLVGMLTRNFASYSMVIVGGFITALSFVFMALPTSVFEELSGGWLGKVIGNDYLGIEGVVHPYYIMIFLWQVVFSIGEAFYSPRVYEYAASISPPGQEASYSSLSYVPLLIGKISVAGMIGGLVSKYCPAEGPRDSATMWLIVGTLVMISPVGLLLLSKFIRVKEEGRD